MTAVGARPSDATRRRVARAAGDLGAAAVRQMETDHGWFRSLSAENRSWVGLVAQAGIAAFLDWFGGDHEVPTGSADVFGTAPRELTRSISLAQTLDLIRTVIGVVEREIAGLAAPGEADLAREAVLRYSREVAFSAAQVYAQAAEARGAWDARLESLVVDAVIRGEADESMQSRAAALGWGAVADVAVVVGSTPGGSGPAVGDLHREARRLGGHLLVAVHGPRTVCVAGGLADAGALARALDTHLGDGPLVVGPTVPHLFAAGRSARAAISGHSAAAAWPAAPRPVLAEELLAERALLGDLPARNALVGRIVRPLEEASAGALLETAAAWLDGGLGVEGTARALVVHPNTVRYRLAGIAKLVGYDLADPHDAQTVRVALAYSRLGPAARSVIRPSG
ncbi:MAG: PucR family transcriptional regulator [Phycicoccus sp.]